MALAAFLVHLVAQDPASQALTGVLFLAVAVLASRLIGTAADGGWSHPYTRMAIPVEAGFALVVAAVVVFTWPRLSPCRRPEDQGPRQITPAHSSSIMITVASMLLLVS